MQAHRTAVARFLALDHAGKLAVLGRFVHPVYKFVAAKAGELFLLLSSLPYVIRSRCAASFCRRKGGGTARGRSGRRPRLSRKVQPRRSARPEVVA